MPHAMPYGEISGTGPRYLQILWSNRIVATCLLFLMFPKRPRTIHDGQVHGWWMHYPSDFFDPSEACNSTAIWAVYTSFFRPIRFVFSGRIVYPIYEGCGHRWVPTGRRADKKRHSANALTLPVTSARRCHRIVPLALTRCTRSRKSGYAFEEITNRSLFAKPSRR